MTTYVIYRHPLDHPAKFVVREWFIGDRFYDLRPADEPTAVVDTIEEARAALPPGLVRVQRQRGDDWSIYETWL